MARLIAEIPDEEHTYLKMCCAKLKMSLKDFIRDAVIARVDAFEDEWIMERMKKEGKWNRKFTIIERDGTPIIIYANGEEDSNVHLNDYNFACFPEDENENKEALNV